MTPDLPAGPKMDHASREEILAALFANMVVQQSNMALMFLGKVPHPETGERFQDLEAAKLFIDQLEMIEAKTRGNLNRQEDGLLKQSLSALHLEFARAVDDSVASESHGRSETAAPPASAFAAEPSTKATASTSAPAPSSLISPETAAPAQDPDSRKKFSKKY